MGTKEKLIERFKHLPKDFSFEETVKLLGVFGYEVHNKGASASQVLVCVLRMHKRENFCTNVTGVKIHISLPNMRKTCHKDIILN